MATEGIGHNSKQPSELGLLIERVERLLEEKKGIADDIRDVMAEAKASDGGRPSRHLPVSVGLALRA